MFSNKSASSGAGASRRRWRVRHSILFFALLIGLAYFAHDGAAGIVRSSWSVPTLNYQLVSFAVPAGNAIFHTFRSQNLSTWHEVTASYGCTILMRDPSIMNFNGRYYMTHTGSCTGTDSSIGWTSSLDGVNWNADQFIDFTTHGDVNAKEVWAPEWFIDPNASGLSSVHIFVSVSDDESFFGFQMFEIHPTSPDFSTWSNIQSIPITGEASAIDAFMVFRSGTYYLFYKHQDPGQSCAPNFINYASSATLIGTYTQVRSVSDWAGWGCAEGPALIQTPTGWRIFFDVDNNSFNAGQLNYSDSNNNWASWTAPIPIATPVQAKHGTVIQFPFQ